MSRRPRFPWVPLLAGAAIGVALVLGGVLSVTRSQWGRARLLTVTLEAIGGKLQGRLQVDHLRGNLLTGAKLYQVTLDDLGGTRLLAADSAFIDYRLPTFFSGDIVIRRLALFNPRIFLRRLPGDSLWNYQHILQDTSRADSTAGNATLIDRLRLVNASVEVQIPWVPDTSLTPRQRARQVAGVLADTSSLVVRAVPGGYLRSMFFSVDTARVGRLTVAPDERGGIFMRILSGSGEARLYRGEPLRIRQAKGQIALRDGIMRYEAPAVALPHSNLATEGVIDIRDGNLKYDVVMNSDRVALDDMRWLFPRYPRNGTASFHAAIETRPEGLHVEMHDLRLRAPGTRVTGAFGMVLGDSVVFTDVNLQAEPVDVQTVQRLLPADIPVQGLRIGAIEVHSPAS